MNKIGKGTSAITNKIRIISYLREPKSRKNVQLYRICETAFTQPASYFQIDFPAKPDLSSQSQVLHEKLLPMGLRSLVQAKSYLKTCRKIARSVKMLLHKRITGVVTPLSINRPTGTRPSGLFSLTQWKFSLPGTQRIF